MSLADSLKGKGKKEFKNVSVISLIDAYLATRSRIKSFEVNTERNPEVGFHPSEIDNACPRQIAFRYLKEKKYYKKSIVTDELYEVGTNNTHLERIFDQGHVIHSLIYSYLVNYGAEFATETSVDGLKEYFIMGTADIVIKLQDGKKYLGDVKSIRSELFNKLKTVDDIQKRYLTQASIYAKGLSIKNCFILFWNKNTGELKEFFFKRDEVAISKALKNAKNAKNFLLGKKKLPILEECKVQSGKYMTCDFSSICFFCKDSKKLLGVTEKKSFAELGV